MGTLEMLRDISDPEWQKAHMDMGFYSPIGELYKELGIIPKTNADCIRSMSIDKLIEWFCRGRPCGSCPYGGEECGIRDWLESPEKGEE